MGFIPVHDSIVGAGTRLASITLMISGTCWIFVAPRASRLFPGRSRKTFDSFPAQRLRRAPSLLFTFVANLLIARFRGDSGWGGDFDLSLVETHWFWSYNSSASDGAEVRDLEVYDLIPIANATPFNVVQYFRFPLRPGSCLPIVQTTNSSKELARPTLQKKIKKTPNDACTTCREVVLYRPNVYEKWLLATPANRIHPPQPVNNPKLSPIQNPFTSLRGNLGSCLPCALSEGANRMVSCMPRFCVLLVGS